MISVCLVGHNMNFALPPFPLITNAPPPPHHFFEDPNSNIKSVRHDLKIPPFVPILSQTNPIHTLPNYLIFIGPCIIIYSYSTTNNITCYIKLFILVKRSTYFGRSIRPSSGAQMCVFTNDYLLLSQITTAAWRIPLLYTQFWAPDDGRKDRPKHVERFWE
jgi:hypothetical protein